MLILDEPANGLDPAGIRDIRVLLRRLGDQGRTVLCRVHLLAEVRVTTWRCCAGGAVSPRVRRSESVLASVGTRGVIVRLDDVAAGLAALEASGCTPRIEDEGTSRGRGCAGCAPRGRSVGAPRGVARELRPGGANLEEAFMALTGDGAPSVLTGDGGGAER